MKKIILLSLSLAMILFSSSSFAVTSQYDFKGFASSFALTDSGIPFNYSNDCSIQMSSRNSFQSTVTFDSTITWKSPDANTIGFSTLTGISNTSCLSYGQTALKAVSRDVTSNIYESSWDVTHSATSGFVNTETKYLCDSPTEITSVIVTRENDSRLECQWLMRSINSDSHASWITELENSYNSCGNLNGWISASPCTAVTTGLAGTPKTVQYIYPINASSIGQVNYSFTDASIKIGVDGGTPTFDYYIDIIDIDTGTTTNVHTTANQTVSSGVLFNIPDVTGTLSLTPDNHYLWVVTFNKDRPLGFQSSIAALDNPIMNNDIFTFRPDYVCGDFGPCINGTQSQVCVDSFGVAPDEIRTRSCFDVPAHEIDLGFEAIVDIISPFIFICQKDWRVTGCFDFLETIPARFPVNWTISADADIVLTDTFRQNYIRISDDTSTVGTKSLQMNYIPPKPSEPVNNGTGGTECGNKTSGDFPFVTTGLNQSLFVSINISFPSPFIQLRLDARKCSEQLLQYDYTGDFLGINCGKRCYAPNCTGEPRGNFRVGVFDAQTLEQIVEFSDAAINSWKSHIIDLSNAGLLVNHNYTIIIVVNPQTETGVFDPNSHCVYFDNFRVTITERALPECITRCEGLNLLLATQNGDICFFTEITNSPECAPDQSTAEAFQNFDTVCIGTTLHFFNNDTGLWDQTLNSDICIEQISDAEQAIETTEPIGDIQELGETFSFLFSPLFLYLISSIVLTVIATSISKHWQIGAITMSLMVFIGSIPSIGLVPIWVTIAIIAVTIVLISSKVTGKAFNIGGG